MTLVLQNKRNSAFIEGLAGAWTIDREQAHVFLNSLDALSFCFKRRLPNMQILAMFHNPKLNFTVPVTDMAGD